MQDMNERTLLEYAIEKNNREIEKLLARRRRLSKV